MSAEIVNEYKRRLKCAETCISDQTELLRKRDKEIKELEEANKRVHQKYQQSSWDIGRLKRTIELYETMKFEHDMIGGPEN